MVYTIRIEEVLSRFVRVEAGTKEDAEKKVEKMYNEGKIVLDSEDFLSVEFQCLRQRRIK